MKLEKIAYRTTSGEPMVETDQSVIYVDSGVEGDAGRKEGRFTITVLSKEAWLSACEEVQQDLPWTVRRANLLVTGYEFSESDVGKRFSIGGVTLQITRETNPCDLMEAACPGLFNALSPKWRGGVRAQVIKGGRVEAGQDCIWQN